MTRTEFSAWCRSVRLLDGATGSMLRTAGMPAGVCSESWILSHPQPLLDLQRAYLSASSEVIYAPTFGANRVLLGHHGLQDEVSALNRDLVQLSREAVGTEALLAGDMTTTGQPVLSGDDSAYAALLDIYREQAEALLHAGIDLFAVETMMGVTECMAAVEAIRSLCDVPILCTLSVYSDGKCYFDGSAEEAAEVLPGLGADAVGLNCSSGPDQMGTVVRMMKKCRAGHSHRGQAQRRAAHDHGDRRGCLSYESRGLRAAHARAQGGRRKPSRRLLRHGACVYRSAPRAALSLIRPAFRADSPAPAQVEVQAQSRTPRRASPRPCASCAVRSS